MFRAITAFLALGATAASPVSREASADFEAVASKLAGAKQPEVVKSRHELIKLYCNTGVQSLVHTTSAEKVAAAKRGPCQLLAYHKTLEDTVAAKKEVAEAKSKLMAAKTKAMEMKAKVVRGITPAAMRVDRKAMYETVCKQGASYAANPAVASVCANQALKILMTTGGGKGRAKGRAARGEIQDASATTFQGTNSTSTTP